METPLKVITAATDDLENPEDAIKEIKDAIGKGGGLLANSVAIVSCPPDYVMAGFTQYLGEHLDFPFLGCTTSNTATEGSSSPTQLSMMIFTSDSVRFRVGMTEPLSPPKGADWNDAEIRRHLDKNFLGLYQELTEGFSAPPSLAVPLLPDIPDYADQLVSRVLFGPHEDLRFFGTKAADVYRKERQGMPMVFCDQEISNDRAALMVCEEGLKPRFFLSDVLKENIIRRKAIITKSSRNTLYEINDRPVPEFLESMGLDCKNLDISLNTTPFVLLSRDYSTHHPRVFVASLRDGGILFNGAMPEGMSVAVAVLDADAIIETAQSLFSRVAALPDVKATFFYSCLARQTNLGWDELRELRLLEAAWEGNPAPWMLAYSGGEICPRTLPDGTLQNAFLCFTTTALVL
ncbi:MAG: FIST C-terminal domain-containing protein [Deltaproteobacteria bacterium]|nr:FIST C-terminal domain-containing protein [Deltaproteobacteria bacterium]